MHNMVNPHIVVGENRRCICGNHDGTDITCADILSGLRELQRYVFTADHQHTFTKIEKVFRSLLVECSEPHVVENVNGTHH